MKIKWKELIISILIPLAVGGVSALLTMGEMEAFEGVMKPPLSPPSSLFPIVWIILYILMGISTYLIYTANVKSSAKNSALKVYGFQLLVNFFWSLIFFNMKFYLFAFIWLLLLLALIIIIMVKFYPISKVASYLFIPYLIWVCFAGYLNFGIYLLN